MWLRNNALLLVLGAALIAIVSAITAVRWAERELLALAKNVYYEAVLANEPELSSRMVAYVTNLRAKANDKYWGGRNIHNVVYARHTKKNGVVVCQFHWTCLAAAHLMPTPGPRWELAQRIARDELSGRFTPPAHLVDVTSYLNPKYSGKSNICEFQTKLVFAGKADRTSQHIFFRIPKDDFDKVMVLKREEVPECPAPPKNPQKKATTAAR